VYRVIQEKRSIIWEVIVSVIVSKKVHMNIYVCVYYRERRTNMINSHIKGVRSSKKYLCPFRADIHRILK
jgi:hypothetical protein